MNYVRGGCRSAAVAALVALASAGTSQAAFEIPGPPGGADGRKYEIVSPARKDGYSVSDKNSRDHLSLRVSPDGNTVAYGTFFALPGSETGGGSGLLGQRTDSGWQSVGLPKVHGPNQTGSGTPTGIDTQLRGTTPDGRTSVYWDCSSEPFGALWIRRVDGSRQRIADATEYFFCDGGTAAEGQPWFQGISPDGRHVAFVTHSRLGPAADLAPGFGRILYEWVDDGGAGALRVVNRTNAEPLDLIDAGSATLGGSASAAGGFGRPSLFDSATAQDFQWIRNAISDGSDGHSRIFFQNPMPADVTQGGGTLYMRQDGTETVALSVAAPGYVPTSPPAATGVRYIDASRDGTRVYFYADGDLAPGAPPSGGLYLYDVNGTGTGQPSLTWVGPAGTGVRTTGVADDDGSHLYYQDGPDIRLAVGGTTRVVLADAVVNVGSASRVVGGEVRFGDSSDSVGFRTTNCVSADVSPDGRYLAFVANRLSRLISSQIYRYDAAADDGRGRAEVISTSPTAPATVLAAFTGNCIAGTGRADEKHVMSDDGQYVFFDTPQPLVPTDTNGNRTIDVYRWHNGDVQLISSGTSPGESSFMGTDSTGSNAFFLTPEPLVPQDGDEVADLYTARIGGGYPVPPRSGCEGDVCQGPTTPPPGLDDLGSVTFSGPGNVESDEFATTPVFHVSALSARARRAFARTGRVTLRVQVSGAGRVVANASARVGRRTRTVARAARTASQEGGTVSLRLSLSRAARAELRRRGKLKTRISVSYSAVRGKQSATVTLKRSASRRAPKRAGRR